MKEYVRDFIVAMVAYAVLLPLSIFAFRATDIAWLRVIFALVPIIPTALGLLAITRGIRTMDELERRIHFEAVAFAFGATALLTFAYGLLENVAFPPASWTFILPFMVVMWTLGQALARRRY